MKVKLGSIKAWKIGIVLLTSYFQVVIVRWPNTSAGRNQSIIFLNSLILSLCVTNAGTMSF